MSKIEAPHDLMFHLAAQVLSLRRNRGLGRDELARRAGLTSAHLYRLESATSIMFAADLAGLAAALEVRPSALFGGLAPQPAPAPRVSRAEAARAAAGKDAARYFARIGRADLRRRLTALTVVAGAGAGRTP